MKTSFIAWTAVGFAAFIVVCHPANAQTPVPAPTVAPAPAPAPAPAIAQAPVANAAPAIAAEELQALRDVYAGLKEREAQARSASLPETAQTLSALTTTQNRIEQLQAAEPLDQWKTTTLEYLLGQMQAKPPILPPNVPSDMAVDPAVVQLAANTVLYDNPDLSKGAQLGLTAAPTPVLRVASHGPMMMIWTPDSGFAFVVSQFVEVFE